jgi:hypothetical protein
LKSNSLLGAISCAIFALSVTARSHAVSPPASNASLESPHHQAFLRPFPAPQIPGAYDLSPHAEFHYALPYAEDAVCYAAYRVYQRFGETGEPMSVCDCSTAYGTTPAGRHPSGAHDDGRNFDITYFMNRPAENFIVCPSHADGHCTGPALDLDADRQAYFFAALGQLDEEVGEGLITRMAVDGQVLQAVTPALDRLAASGAMPRNSVERAKQLVYGELTDLGTGWYRFHYNHTHLRFFWRPQDKETVARGIEFKISRLVSVVNHETPLR